MKRLMLGDMYSWSRFSEERQIDFNGHLWVRPEGNVLIDPVPMIDSDLVQLDELGGVGQIVITNRDHEREAAFFKARTGAQIVAHSADAEAMTDPPDRTLEDGEVVVDGLVAAHLSHGKSPGEIALFWPERKVVLSGDLVVGAPMGRLTLLKDEKLADPPRAALALRKLMALDFDVLLVGDGHSVFQQARQRLIECLEERVDIYVNRVNEADVEWDTRPGPAGYNWQVKEIDAQIGARHLGYRLIRLPPGSATFPLHFHYYGEEMFYLTEGGCTLLTPRGEIEAVAGDFVAFPPGPASAHKFVNRGTEPCVMLALGAEIDGEVAEYPDSKKVLTKALPGRGIFRLQDAVTYWDGE
jgi:uncharacterized cupin superfamily protein